MNKEERACLRQLADAEHLSAVNGRNWRLSAIVSALPKILNALDAADARIAELENAAAWKPAKDAPRHQALLVKMADGTICVAHRDDDSAWWDCHVDRAGDVSYFSTQVIDEPTHYRELPAAPEGLEATRGRCEWRYGLLGLAFGDGPERRGYKQCILEDQHKGHHDFCTDAGGATVLELCSRCGERERDDPLYCDECSARLALEHEVDVHKARIAELEKLLATEASDREAALAAEVARLKAIFDDAGQGEANVLGLIDHYQDRILELEKRVEDLSAATEEEAEPAQVEESLTTILGSQPSVESLRRRIRHQRREIRMLHRLREMESVSARRGREIALARMYDAGTEPKVSTHVHVDEALRLSMEREIKSLRQSLSEELVDLSAERSWCRSCRTEGTGALRGYATHPHSAGCKAVR